MSGRLRILCLHGFTSNGTVHAHQVRRITALLPEYEFLFPDGPHRVDIQSQMDLSNAGNQAWSDFVTELSDSGHRAWYFAREDSEGNKQSGSFVGIEESLASIGAIIRETGPIHAIWGFSQGGGLAGILCALFQDRLAEHPLRQHLGTDTEITAPKAGIIFSGFRARFQQYNSLYETGGIDIPTLHVMGEKDQLTTGERSQELIDVCSDAVLLRHPGGHDIPKSEADQRRVVNFVRKHVGGERGASEKFQASM